MQTEPITQHSKYGDDLDITTVTTGHHCVSTCVYRGVSIKWSYDSQSDDHSGFYVTRNGIEEDFESLDGARDSIDSVLDTEDNAGFNAMDEWGLGMSDVI